MIFQDPMTTLNPVLRIDTQMIEAIQAHENVSGKAARDRARQALARVGIPSPEERLDAYPHQFSGGMRQRVAIAIALLHRPAVLVADEPTTALDVTIQAQILSEVQTLAAETGTAMLWITHDLSVIAGFADRIAVMYAGRIVETGSVVDVLETADPSLYRRAHRLGAEPQPARRAARPDPRHDAFAREASAGLPVLAALPARDRDLPHHHAGRDAVRRRAHGALPSSAYRRAPGGVRP